MSNIDFFCWIILASSSLTSAMAVIGLISNRFKDTMFQCFSLCMVAFGGFVVTLQIYIHGMAQISGIALEALSIAIYSFATFMKYARVKNGTT
jgi:hypothetical protein